MHIFRFDFKCIGSYDLDNISYTYSNNHPNEIQNVKQCNAKECFAFARYIHSQERNRKVYLKSLSFIPAECEIKGREINKKLNRFSIL